MMKRCPTCGNDKPLDAFQTDRSRKDGLCVYCRECSNARSRAWNAANPEQRRATGKVSSRAYYERNRDTMREQSRAHYANNLEWYRNRQRNKRAALRRVASERFSESDVLTMWGTDCHICGEAINLDAPRRIGANGWERSLHLDHVIPISAGGENVLANVKPAHGICNVRKRATIVQVLP